MVLRVNRFPVRNLRRNLRRAEFFCRPGKTNKKENKQRAIPPQMKMFENFQNPEVTKSDYIFVLTPDLFLHLFGFLQSDFSKMHITVYTLS